MAAQAKHRERFFQLADVFLSSTLVPAYTVAAFAKRFARLALTASPSGDQQHAKQSSTGRTVEVARLFPLYLRVVGLAGVGSIGSALDHRPFGCRCHDCNCLCAQPAAEAPCLYGPPAPAATLSSSTCRCQCSHKRGKQCRR